jgi:hypothetical protein
MTSKLYYVMTLGRLWKHGNNFVASHWVPLDTEFDHDRMDDSTEIFVLICTRDEMHFALSEIEGIHTLPHPMSNKKLGDHKHPVSGEHIGRALVQKLSGIGVTENDLTSDAARKAGQKHPLMRLVAF